MRKHLFNILMVILVFAIPSVTFADYYRMASLGNRSGWRAEINSDYGTSDFFYAEADGFMRGAFTKSTDLEGSIYLCELYNADSDGDGDLSDETLCVNAVSLTATNTNFEIESGRVWLVFDISTAETSGTSYLTIRGHYSQASSGSGGAFAGTADYLVAGEDGVADAVDPRDGDGLGDYDDPIACNATFGACLFQSSTGNVWTYDQTNTEWTCATCRRRIIAPVDGKLFFSGTVQTDCLDFGATSNVERLDADLTAACNSTGGGISLGTPSSPPTIEVFCHDTVSAYSGTEGVDISITMDDGSTALTTLNIPDAQSTASTTGESVCLSTPVRMTAGAANSSYRLGLYARDGTNCQNGSGCAAPNGTATGTLSLEIMYP